PAAPGGDSHGRQGRRARGARPPRRARGAGAQADRAGRRHRPPARFSLAGAQPRGQHAVLEIERRRADQYRARAEKRGRAVPRAGAEPGVSAMEGKAGTARRSDAITRRGLMLVLSSPSGAGKTTLSRLLLQADPNIAMSVSVTTRPPRPSEVDGRDYH